MQVMGEDGSVVVDRDAVLERWKRDFESIYQGLSNVNGFNFPFFLLSCSVG